jgi:peptide/nickel transport system permease protein
MTYIVRRVLSGLLIVFALTWIAFALFWLLPAEPWRAVLNDPTRQYTKAEIAAANHKLGVDRPVVVQYGKYVWRLVRHGDFGHTYYGSPVWPQLKRAMPVTWSIVLGGAVLLFLIALPLATVSALRANTAFDRTILGFSIAGVAVHPFILGAGLTWLFRDKLHWVGGFYYCPLRGTVPISTAPPGAPDAFAYPTTNCGGVVDWSTHLLLPWITFALIFLPLYMRMLRAAMIEVLEAPYVMTARAKGVGPIRLMRSHVLRNALLQPLTMIGMEIGLALTVSIYIEVMYDLFGAGRLAVGSLGYGNGTAVSGTIGGGGNFELPVVAGIIFLIAVTVIVLNLVIDLAYAYLDPRVRFAGRAAEAAT